jgi:lysozyme family protein
MSFEKSLELVLKHEGGYTGPQGLKGDAGGETMMGVTKAAWSTWLKRHIEDGEMAKLTVADITPFYKALYWDKSYCNQLPPALAYMVFDASVNMGVGQSIRLLQKSLGCVSDGVIGPNTMKAINDADVKTLINKFSTQKEQFYKSLGNFNLFGKGWLRRVAEVQQAALSMLPLV